MPTDNTPCVSDQDLKSVEKDLYASHTQRHRDADEGVGDPTKRDIYEENQPPMQGSPFEMDRQRSREHGVDQQDLP